MQLVIDMQLQGRINPIQTLCCTHRVTCSGRPF